MGESMNEKKAIESIEDVTKIQTCDGNWNYSPYMMGMANGLILALAILKGEDPIYKETPKVWLKDIPSTPGDVPGPESAR